MISLICPTRGRKEKFDRMVDSALATCCGEIEIISGSNGGDKYVDINFPLDCPTVYMWNEMAKEARGDFFMLAADDIIFSTPCWDQALEIKDKPHVYHYQDSRDTDGTPHPIVNRKWADTLGYFLPPIFMHWYVDTWTVEIAKSKDCFTHLRDYLLIHDKDSDKGLADETHNRIRRMGWRERDKQMWECSNGYREIDKRLIGDAL